MPYGSVIAAAMAKYNATTPTLFPGNAVFPIYLDEAAQEGPAGAQLRPPYTIINDLGDEPQWTFGNGSPGENAIIWDRFRLTIYTVGLADADAAMAAVLWNGQIPNNRAGLAFAVLDLSSPYKCLTVYPGSSQRKYSQLNYQGARVYSVTQDFKAQVALSGTGY